MANDPLTFPCPACGIKLTVPATLAGVTGPCPTCHAQIQAPYSPSPEIPRQVEIQRPPANPSVYQPPVSQLPPVGYEPITAPLPVAATPDYQSPPLAAPPAQAPPTTPAILRPEPRQLPSRANHSEPAAKQMPEPISSGETSRASQPPARHSRQKNRLIRVLIPLLFVFSALAIGLGVATVLKDQSKESSDKTKPAAPSKPILPTPPVEPEPPAEPTQSAIPSLPVPAPEEPAIISPIPSLPDGLEPKAPGTAAREVLDKFLTAKTLAERLPLIETRTPEPELAKSSLAAPLPAASFLIGAVENNPVEQVVDYYHNVNFDAGENRTNPHTILVRTRGSAEPKIVVDPFLDSYGGRLAAYAKTPTDKAANFQVTIWPLASCYDEKVPDREKKLTLKLLPQEDAKEIALAYFGKQSKIAEMLEDGTYSLSYGKAKACTVMLRWNMEENAAMPYLEAIALKSLDWNP